MTKYLFISAMVAAALTCGCSDDTTTGVRARQEADAAAERARAEGRDARESAKRAWDARLTQIENRIKALKADAKPQARKARKATEEKIDVLEEEARDLRRSLSKVDDKAADAWDKVKDSTESAFNKIEKKLDEWKDDVKRRID